MKRIKLFSIAAFLVSLLVIPTSGYGQNTTVRGTVKDKAGTPLAGVTIIMDSAAIGTATDAEGVYQLSVPADATLIYSFIGYLPVTVNVGGRTQIDVVLEDDSEMIDEVVVIGYGTARRSDVTGSISSISSDALREVPSASMSQALQGRLAGVDLTQSSSRPGAEMRIRVRGTRSLNASNDPLVVLDGIPFAGTISDINPVDIKSIDILKDASSTAIYGSRGANGVILVTTNKGVMSKPSISYNGYHGIKTVFSEYPMFNGPEFVEFRNQALANGSPWGGMSVDDDPNVNTNWQDLIYRKGMVTSHDVGVSAGSDRGSYNFGAGVYSEESPLPSQSYTRFSIRGGFDQQIGKIFKVGMTTQNSYSITNGENTSGMYNILQTNPTISPYNPDGTIRDDIIELNTSDKTRNPLLMKYSGADNVDQRKSFASYNSVYGEVNIWDGLRYRVNVGVNYRQSNYGSFLSADSPYADHDASLATASISNSITTNWTVENLLYYDKTFGRHSVNAVLMYSAEQTRYNYSSVSARGIAIDDLQYYNLGLRTDELTVDPSTQDYWKRGLISYMGRVAYGYDNRYLITATFRSDGSSVLAEGSKWHTYPAVSVGWNIANEEFMKGIAWLPQLKLRVGYGQTSNQSIDPYATLGGMTSMYYNYGGTGVLGYYPSSVPNSALGWEYSTTWNYGLDFGLWGGRLTGTIEYYTQKTKDILMQLDLPATSGIASSFWANVGETSNKGFELTLNGVIFNDRNGWSWDVGFNIYSNKNRIVKLAGDQDRNVNQGWFVGHPIDVIYDYNKIGIFQLGEEAIAAASYNGGQPGTIKVSYNLKDGDPVTFDANGVPSRVINGNDREILGQMEPKVQGGFNTTVAYKNIDLGIVGMFRGGGYLISTLHMPQGYLNMMSGRRGNVKVDYWTTENPTNKYPMVGGTTGDQDAPVYGSTLGYFKASYLKIRTMTLGYTLQGRWMEKIGLENARIYFTVQNPFVLFSPYNRETGLDPETNTPRNENTAVSDGLSRHLAIGINTPATRNYIFGLNFRF